MSTFGARVCYNMLSKCEDTIVQTSAESVLVSWQGYHISRLAADLHDFIYALDLQVTSVSQG